MPGRGRMNQSYWQFATVPYLNGIVLVEVRNRDVQLGEPLRNPRLIVLKPIGDQNWLPVGLLDQIL